MGILCIEEIRWDWHFSLKHSLKAFHVIRWWYRLAVLATQIFVVTGWKKQFRQNKRLFLFHQKSLLFVSRLMPCMKFGYLPFDSVNFTLLNFSHRPVCHCENQFHHTLPMRFFPVQIYFVPALILLTHIFSFHWIH